jgi:phage terminase large subunit
MSTCDLIINDAYWPALDSPLHYLELMGGRGSGKSHFVGKQMIPLGCLQGEPLRVMAMRKVATTIRLSIWRSLTEGIKALGLYGKCNVNKTDREIHFPNGSVIACAGADDPEKLKSLEGFDWVWKEEASEFTEEDHLNIDAAIKSPRKKSSTAITPSRRPLTIRRS